MLGSWLKIVGAHVSRGPVSVEPFFVKEKYIFELNNWRTRWQQECLKCFVPMWEEYLIFLNHFDNDKFKNMTSVLHSGSIQGNINHSFILEILYSVYIITPAFSDLATYTSIHLHPAYNCNISQNGDALLHHACTCRLL